MYCPECRLEFNPGIVECSDCHVALVEELPPDPALEDIELSTVFFTGDEAIAGLAESLLRGAGIVYISKGEGAHDLFGLSPIEIQVDSRRAEEARDLLAHLPQGNRVPSDGGAPET
ncbi:MAG: DUF2007 domain-containing protein [Candidatus Hydrogenedentes bacterium]|nr:DUF2007 domain-containing protein [Candidatus Hydrogenedentota bacterium]